MRYIPVKRRICLVPALGLLLAALVSACSSSTLNPQYAQGSFSAAPSSVRPSAVSAPAVPPSAGSSAGSSRAGAGSQITASWNAFFSSSAPDSKRVRLLQNGSQFASSVRAFAASPLAAAVTSKVDSVTLSSATRARVKYDLSASGKALARGASGTAVLQDGTWKVGDDVFCGLLAQARSAGVSVPVPGACSVQALRRA